MISNVLALTFLLFHQLDVLSNEKNIECINRNKMFEIAKLYLKDLSRKSKNESIFF